MLQTEEEVLLTHFLANLALIEISQQLSKNKDK